MARIGVNVYAEESLMRSSVVEPLPSPGLEGRGSQYIPGPATRPLPVPPTTAPERPDAAPVTQKARPRLALAPAEGWFALLLLAAAVYAVISTIIAANWVSHTFILFWSAGFGLLLGLVIAKMRQIPHAILHLADLSGSPAMVGRAGLLLHSADQSELCKQSEFCEAQSIYMGFHVTGRSDPVDCAHPSRHKTGAVGKRRPAHRPHLAAEDKLEFHAVDCHVRAPDPVSQLGIAYGW